MNNKVELYVNSTKPKAMLLSKKIEEELIRQGYEIVKEEADINSPSKLMRDEVGRWLLPGVAVGVEDTVSSTTADTMLSSFEISRMLYL